VVRRDKRDESGVTETTYYLRSSVLGGRVVAELGAQGEAVKQHVYAGGEVLATRDAEGGVEWQHTNPVTGSRAVSYASTAFAREAEPEPLGVDVGFHDPFVEVSTTPVGADDRPTLLSGSGIASGRCQVDGMNVECEDAERLMVSGGCCSDRSRLSRRLTGAESFWATCIGIKWRRKRGWAWAGGWG
jgi:hypothetical protein